MNGITLSMAIVDFIPVVLFFVAAVLLERDLYYKLSKGAFSLLASGAILVLIGGFYKALWKALYAVGACDFVALDQAFFPMQGPGFVLVFIALTRLFAKKKDTSATALSVVPAAYTSNLVFIVLQVVGFAGIQFSMVRVASRMKKRLASVLFILSFVFVMGMGYLGAKFDDSSSMHWLAQVTNILGEGSFLGGVLILHKSGLEGFDLSRKA